MVADHLSGFARHLRVILGLKASTVSAYLITLRGFRDYLEECHAGEPLQRRQIEGFLEALFRGGNENSTRRGKLVAIRKFFDYLVYEGIITENIAEQIPLPRKEKKIVRIFTREEILDFFRAVPLIKDGEPREKYLRDVVILILLAFGGLRAGEILKLNIEDIVNEDRMSIHVIGKGDRERWVRTIWKVPAQFIWQYLLSRMQAHGAGPADPLVCSYRKGGKPKGERLTEGAIDQLVKDLAQDAKIRKSRIHAHMFRSTNATNLMDVEGWDLNHVKAHLGHKSISTTEENYIASGDPHRKKYPSFAALWKDFNLKLWQKGEVHDSSNDGGGLVG